ncbi:MAG: HAD family hydrolase [Acidobacteria bacterium]|nr:HAD family hydrolase [Acidobacteriota bacterium]
MKLSVIALDYDGTAASGDRLDPGVRDAIADARSRGITVLLVTGRILDELRRVAGDLHFVDGVVAENGAVVHFPDSDHTSALAPRVPESFVAELGRRSIRFTAGACLVDGSANDAPQLLQVIRDLELPLVLLFNRGRVMTLPQGVSKATGLHVALDMLRLSPRNALAVGDAENDHALLQLAEVGAAVEWGSAALRAAADLTVNGSGPAEVGAFIRRLADRGRLPAPPRARRRLRLGYAEDGREFSLAVRGRNVLVAGDAKSGKSWIAGLLCEQLILHGYSVCVIDPEGDYRSLEALPGVSILGGEDPPPTPRDLLRALRYPDRSIVIDLSRVPQDEKIDYIRSVLPAVNVMRQRTGLPHRILLDEAHYFLHDGGAPGLLDLERNGYTIVTYCASRLPPELVAATEVMIVTCESNPAEVAALCRRCGAMEAGGHGLWPMLGHLKLGQAAVLPVTEEAGGELKMFTIGQRLTPHVRHRQKYVDVPVTEARAFVFGANGGAPHRARTLREFVDALEHTPSDALGGYVRRGDFSRWIADVYGDHALAEELRAQERRYRAGLDGNTVPEIVGAVRARYDLTDDEVTDAP